MRLAIVTAAYPAVMKYLDDFFNSLKAQSDKDFDLWIALDGVDEKVVSLGFGKAKQARFVSAPPNATPAVVRNKVLEQALQNCDAAVLVDADDVLDATRVAAARESAGKYDVTATAMKYIDSDGNVINGFFDPYLGDPGLVRNNVFGFSNTTWRAQTLAQFLPVPESCVLMDWFVSTLALYTGASLGYDGEARMRYRQHPENIAASRPPFSADQIIKATKRVLGHYDLVLSTFAKLKIEQMDIFEEARREVAQFFKAIAGKNVLKQYVEALNALPHRHVWWSCVAHPALEGIWKK